MLPDRMSTLLLPLVLFTLSMAYAADKAEVGERVEKAREAYKSEMELIREDVAKELDTKEAAERKRANPDLVKIKAIKGDREALSSDGTIPETISTKIKTRITKNRTKLVNVLTAAKNEYLKAKQDDEAEALGMELESLKVDGPQSDDKPPAAASKTTPNKPAVTPTRPAKKRALVASTASTWPKNAPIVPVAPFDFEQIRKVQLLWSKYLKVPIERTNSIGMKLVLIPPGEFMMGSSPEEIDEALKAVPDNKEFRNYINSEAPRHRVVLMQPYYIGMYEVTGKEYQLVMGTDPGPRGANPVGNASWLDAAAFCTKLSEKEKLEPFYAVAGGAVTHLEGNGYRLPTEAEWEFACRAGTTTKYVTGDDNNGLAEVAWFADRAGRGQPVGRLKPNAFNLFDMHGNNLEWVDDTWEPTFYEQFENSTALNPSNHATSRNERVIRGGEWVGSALDCRSSARSAMYLESRHDRVGFRVSLVAVVTP